MITDINKFKLNEDKDDIKSAFINGLNDVYEKTKRNLPDTKKVTKSVSIFDIKPTELLSFMKENNIPDDAYFDGHDNGYDAFDDFLLSWVIGVPTTDKDKENIMREQFTNNMFSRIYKIFTQFGYTRAIYSSSKMRKYNFFSVYDKYLEKEFDELFDYYMEYYKKD